MPTAERRGTFHEGHRKLALIILNMPPPDSKWADEAACGGVEENSGGAEGVGTSERRKAEKVFREQYCTRCNVRDACIYIGVTASANDGVWGNLG